MSAACDRVLDKLSEGQDLDSADNSHVSECAQCRALTGEDAELEQLFSSHGYSAPKMSEALAAMAAQPVRPAAMRSPVVRALVAVAPGFALLVTIVLVAIRRDFSSLSWLARWAPVLSLLSLSVVGVGLASARGRDNLGPSHNVRLGIAVATVAVFELLSIALGTGPWWGGEASHHIACAVSATALPSALTPLTLLALRRTDPVRPALSGAAVGAAVAAITAVIQHLECASPSMSHVAFTHGVSFVVGASLGAWLGRRWLSP
jgi:hypothetical protein